MLSGQAFIYLHYADMIANGYHRTMPCPFQSQGLLLNPNGDLFYCENSKRSATCATTRPRSCTSRRRTWHTGRRSRTSLPTCLSPCQVNVGAMKQVVPYAKFLKRAYTVKRDPSKHRETLPTVP